MSDELKRLESILSKVRARVSMLIKEGNATPDIAIALAYVATEVGLKTFDDNAKAILVTLTGVMQAFEDHKKQTESSNASVEPKNTILISTLIH